MDNAMNVLLSVIRDDYYSFMTRRGRKEVDDVSRSMIERFNEKLSYSFGKKYIRVMTNGSVWGFIVNTDTDKKFRKGDILKAAGYNAPARNQARGNILDGGYEVQWTGPYYLR